MDPAYSEDEERFKPFKLCFAEKIITGRSNILPDKPLNLPHIVTPKFYQKLYENGIDEKLEEKYLEKLKVKGPREKYKFPKTESQKYGWYQVRLTDIDKSDHRLNFHKHTDIIVKEHLMNYEKIRE